MMPNASIFTIDPIPCKQIQRHTLARTSVYIIQAAEYMFFYQGKCLLADFSQLGDLKKEYKVPVKTDTGLKLCFN